MTSHIFSLDSDGRRRILASETMIRMMPGGFGIGGGGWNSWNIHALDWWLGGGSIYIYIGSIVWVANRLMIM